MSSGKVKFQFNKEYFSDFVDKMQDLAQISDVIKLKINKEFILAYSLVANDVAVLCLKSYLLETNQYIKGLNNDLNYDLVVSPSSKFVKNIKFFEDFSVINGEFNFKSSYEDESIMHIRAINISTPASKGDRLKITLIGSELSKIRDLNKNTLDARMNPKLSKWGFVLNQEDLASIKKMCAINSDDKTINIIVDDSIVYFSEEGKWNLQVSDAEFKNVKITFNKKYLSNINTDEKKIDFKIFETFILISDEHSKLLLSFETDFSTED